MFSIAGERTNLRDTGSVDFLIAGVSGLLVFGLSLTAFLYNLLFWVFLSSILVAGCVMLWSRMALEFFKFRSGQVNAFGYFEDWPDNWTRPACADN